MRSIATDVAWSVHLCVSLWVTTVSRTRTAEPLEVPFGTWTRVGPRNHVLDRGGKSPPGEDKRQVSYGMEHPPAYVRRAVDMLNCIQCGSSGAAFRCQ